MMNYSEDVNSDNEMSGSGTKPAQIAAVNDENNLVDCWTSYDTDTEAGSSGSHVLSQSSHTVIALYFNGACKNSGASLNLIIQDLERNQIDLPVECLYLVV
jgi:hypothetical protein